MRPDVEARFTNHLDFWTVSRTNSLGFLDREPVSPERAAAGCHVVLIGDSFVEAQQIPIAEKFQVRLEELAARELPHLDVATSAFGRNGLGQIAPLPFHDAFARRLRPKLPVLVFVSNDFMNDTVVLTALFRAIDPDRVPFVTAERGADGTVTLRPPFPAREFGDRHPWQDRQYMPVVRGSCLAHWLNGKVLALFPHRFLDRWEIPIVEDAKTLSRRPFHASLLDGWRPTTTGAVKDVFAGKELPPYFEEALDFTAFALDRFKKRAERDGASLVILSTRTMGTRGSPSFGRLNAMAEARGIPVMNRHDRILRQGAEIKDAHWAHDLHRNAAGHRWAAEALLEYLKRNQDVCARPSPPREG